MRSSHERDDAQPLLRPLKRLVDAPFNADICVMVELLELGQLRE